MINIKGFEIPNTTDELTVEQFDRLNKINLEQEDHIEKWIAKFTYLGVNEEVFDEMNLEEFKAKVKEFNDIPTVDNERVFEVNIDGFDYVTSEAIGAKDLSLIEKCWKKDRTDFAADMLSILFKRKDLGRKEHYSEAHIKHKKSLFKKQPCRLAMPHIIAVTQELVTSAENATTE